MEIRPRVLFDRPLESIPKVSLILLDWSVRETFHILHYLAKQDVPRDWFEILWIEYFDREAEDIRRRIVKAESRAKIPPIDRWITLNMPRSAYYHKHAMYNVGIIASRGELVTIADSDAMVTPRFVRRLVETFEGDRNIVLHLDEVRSHKRSFYPFNYPTFKDVLGEGCINWRDGRTTGLADEFDPLHARNYGACICARRDDVIAIGGADEHHDYLGHVCGPYDLTWRLVNFGRREVWDETEFLYHVWHPGSDGDENYMGPHDGRQLSSVALGTRRSGRVMPLVENPVIRELRTTVPMETSLTDTLARAIGQRPFSDWVIDDLKRAVSAGRTALAHRRYRDALVAWQPVLGDMSRDAFFQNELGWVQYYLGAYDAAIEAFDRSLALDDQNADAWRGRGWALANRGDAAAAIDSFTRAVERADPLLRSAVQEAYRGRAWAYLNNRQLESAQTDFLAALQLTRPDDPGALQDAHRGLGWVTLHQGQAAQAQLYFLEAIRVSGERRGPAHENALSGLTKADAQLGKAIRAAIQPVASPRDSGTKTRASDQRDIKVRSRLAADLADAYYRAHAYERALKLFGEAYHIDTSNWRAACGLGWAALQLGRLGQANSTFKRIARADDADAATKLHACHGRGWVAYRHGRPREALKEFTRALRFTSAAKTKQARREVAEINRGLRRARYLARTGGVTLRDIAREERAPLLRVALDLQRRALQGRMAVWFARGRK